MSHWFQGNVRYFIECDSKLMDAKEFILRELRDYCRYNTFRADWDGFTWDDIVFLRTAIIRIEHGDDLAWTDFLARLDKQPSLLAVVRFRLLNWGYLYYDYSADNLMIGLFPPEIVSFRTSDAEEFLTILHRPDTKSDTPDEQPAPDRDRKSEIMYIEYKGGSLIGPARIGRVTFSKSRKTIYYHDCRFRSLKGDGYKANYWDTNSGGSYWISSCRADGQDTLYPDMIEIDDNVREEYWTKIRNRPDLVETTCFRSEGKYSKRRPC